jgi:hypothetical protein
MHKSATKCNETLDKWCKNKHGASKIIDTLETYQCSVSSPLVGDLAMRVLYRRVVAEDVLDIGG